MNYITSTFLIRKKQRIYTLIKLTRAFYTIQLSVNHLAVLALVSLKV